MIFNINSAKVKKVPILNADYPNDVTVICGNNAVFNAAIAEDGHPTEYTYQWYVNGAAVDGATASTYDRNTSSDKGVYTVYCKVTNKAGTVQTREATMTVNKAPTLNTSYPANVSVDVTNSATFTVSVTDPGYPTNLTYQWYVNGSAVSGATGTSYTIPSATKGTTSVYCRVSNGVVSTDSRVAALVADRLYIDGTYSLSAMYTEGFNQADMTSVGPIDMTHYSTVTVSVNCETSIARVCISKTYNDKENCAALWFREYAGQVTATVDVSGLQGEYYIVFAAEAYWNTHGTSTFSNIILS